MLRGRGPGNGKDVMPKEDGAKTPPAVDRPGMYEADIEDIRRRFEAVAGGLEEDLRVTREMARALPGLIQKAEQTRGAAEKIGEATVAVVTRLEQLTRRTEELAGMVGPLVKLLEGRDDQVLAKIAELLDARLPPAGQKEKQGRGSEVASQITSKIDSAANSLAAGQADLGAKVEAAMADMKRQLGELGRRIQQDDRRRDAGGDQTKAAAAAAAPPPPPLPQRVDGVIARLEKSVKERARSERGRRLFLVGRVWVLELPEPGGQQKQPPRDALLSAVTEIEQKRKKGEVAVVVVAETFETYLASDGKLADEAAKRRVFITGASTLESFIRAANTGATDGGQRGAAPDLEPIRSLVVEAGRELRELPGSDGVRAKLVRVVSMLGANKTGEVRADAGQRPGEPRQQQHAGAQPSAAAAGEQAGVGGRSGDAPAAHTAEASAAHGGGVEPHADGERVQPPEAGARPEAAAAESEAAAPAAGPKEEERAAPPAPPAQGREGDGSKGRRKDDAAKREDGARADSSSKGGAEHGGVQEQRPQTGGAAGPAGPPALRDIGRRPWGGQPGGEQAAGGPQDERAVETVST